MRAFSHLGRRGVQPSIVRWRGLSDTALLQRVWDEAAVRVVRNDEHSVCKLMEEHERVHAGSKDENNARSWLRRIAGPHRLCLLLEHKAVPLCYLLVSVSPYTARTMNAIFNDEWHEQEPEAGGWSHCNFYSVTALNKDHDHPFANVPVGFPCISKVLASLACACVLTDHTRVLRS
jgi:hypothetical protein